MMQEAHGLWILEVYKGLICLTSAYGTFTGYTSVLGFPYNTVV